MGLVNFFFFYSDEQYSYFFPPQGNLAFGVDGDTTLIENTKVVSVIRELLSTKEENVEKALLYRTVATGRDVIEKQHTTQEASYGRDALAKVISEHKLFISALKLKRHEDQWL